MGSREPIAAAAASACLCWSLAAAAAPPAAQEARSSASLSFFSLFGPGVTVEYERFALPPAASFVSALGFRSTGGDEFTTLTLTTSLEGRLWIGNVGPFRGADRRMTGPVLSLREDVAFTRVEDDRRGRLAGTAIELAETLSAGYRFTLWRLHAAPLLGATVTTQIDPRGRLAPLTFLSGKLAISLGVLF